MVNFSSFISSFSNSPQRVSNYKHHFDKLKIQGFDFTNGFKTSDVKI